MYITEELRDIYLIIPNIWRTKEEKDVASDIVLTYARCASRDSFFWLRATEGKNEFPREATLNLANISWKNDEIRAVVLFLPLGPTETFDRRRTFLVV